MTALRSTTNARNFFASRLFLVVLLVCTSLMALLYARAYYQDYMVRQEIEALEDDIEALETKKLESLKILEYVKSDQFVEETARTQLNMKKEGERAFAESKIQATFLLDISVTGGAAEDLNQITKWWYYFTASK